jgi:SpoVK/Ycf46/Vps4 family AAA+-type ATPase
MREERIKTHKLGLKTGNCLTFNDENTLKQCCPALETEKTNPPTSPRAVRKSAWVNDIRQAYNRYLFYIESSLRFLKNFFSTYNSPLDDSDIFSLIGSVMGMEKRIDIFYSCTTDTIRADLQRTEYGRIKDPSSEDPKDLFMALYKHPKSKAKFCRKLVEWLDYARQRVAEWQKRKQDPAKRRFEELRTLFDLSSVEYDVLLYATLLDERLLRCTDFMRDVTPRDHAYKVSSLLGVTESEYLNTTTRQSKLRRLGCIGDNSRLSNAIMPFINGSSDMPLVNRYFKKNKEDSLPWAFFGSLGEKHGALIKQMIAGRSQNRGINILLYGEPGTGKTSFAQALSIELGYSAYMIAQTDDHENEKLSKTFRLAAVQVCDSQVDQKKSIMIVDEADKMLEGGMGGYMEMLMGCTSGSGDKGEINDILDTLKTPCIWITNSRASQLDPSNRWRFDYSIRFDKLTHAQRKMIWRNVVDKYRLDGIVTDAMLESFAARYEVNAGGISLAVRNLSDMFASGTAPATETESLLKRILEPHCKLLNIKDDAARMVVAQDYSLEGLNIKGNMKLEQIVLAVQRFQTEQGAEGTKGVDRPRMNLLLSGPPGTGKTEFVKYLGSTLNTRVVTRMGIDLLDKYLGGTEQNIKQAFDEASREKAILFLDEIDGMIQSRERAQMSWEVTQVNELLHQMENFDGILIGATNFVVNLDPATLRRFPFKLEFDCLENTGKEIFFARMFGAMGMAGLSPADQRRLQAISSVTPGDFRTVRQSLYYLASAAVTIDQILEGLERESLAKRQGLPQGSIEFR